MTEPYDVDRFFTRLLPAMLDAHREAAARLNGVIQFLVMGRPDRAYALVCLDEASRVEAGEHEGADLWVALDEELLLPMLAGELDVAAAIADERLEIRGDADLLRGLSELFAQETLPETRRRARR